MVHHILDVVLNAEPAKGGGFVEGVVSFFKEGGPFMFVNIFWLACAIAVIIERIVTLMFRYNLNAPPFMEQITKLVLTGNPDRAVKLCGAAPNAPLAKVIRSGLTRANGYAMDRTVIGCMTAPEAEQMPCLPRGAHDRLALRPPASAVRDYSFRYVATTVPAGPGVMNCNVLPFAVYLVVDVSA